jgi:site-specific recombinase XerD
VSGLSTANAALYRDWERKRKGEGYNPLPRNEYALRSLQDYVGGRVLTSLGRPDILDWVGSMDDVAPTTRKTYFSSARAFYNWAASEEEAIIEKSPMAGMKDPKTPEQLPPVPRRDDVRQLIAETEKDRSAIGRRDAAILRVLCDTGGPRASEAAGLLIAGRPHPPGTPAGLGFDPDHDCISVVGKGGRTRTWPVAARTATAVCRWIRLRDGRPLADTHARLWTPFRNPCGPVTRSGIRQMLVTRCDAAGVPQLHPHALRHFSYHEFLEAGGQANDAMILYGWTDEQMPRHYAKSMATDRALKAGHALAIGDKW